jgi:hypothetical protein
MDFITCIIDIASMVIGSPALKGISSVVAIKKILEFFSLGISVTKSVLTMDFEGFISALADEVINDDDNENLVASTQYKLQNYSLDWIKHLISLSSSLDAIANTFSSGPHFYKEVFTYCIDDLNYNIIIQTEDGTLFSLADINNVIE